MNKLLKGLLITGGVVLLFALSFVFYAQFALDYSLESLKNAVQTSQQEAPSEITNRLIGKSLEGLAFEEITKKDANFETVFLLEQAAGAMREAVEQTGYARAGVFLAQVLNERSPRRHPLLQILDSVYNSFHLLLRSGANLGNYFRKRFMPVRDTQALDGTGVLILGEAERMEKNWKLEEAENYYREFLTRYPQRPENGFVSISLAHVLIKLRRLDEAAKLLRKVRFEFVGMEEEIVATTLLARAESVRKRLALIPLLEVSIQEQPTRFFTEEGGVELALNYLTTYQIDKAIEVLAKLKDAPDPRLRSKALFYQAWVYKWKGDLDEGKELFQALTRQPRFASDSKELAVAAIAQLADVHYQKKEFREAQDSYELLSKKASSDAIRAFSEIAKSKSYAVNLNNMEAARRQLLDLDKYLPRNSVEYEVAKKQLEEVMDKSRREEGFNALAEGRIEAATAIFEGYLKKFPRDGPTQSALGSIYLTRAFLDKALDYAQRGYGYQADEYSASVLAFAYEKMERYPEALQFYDIAHQLKEDYVPAHFNLAWVHMKMGNLEAAEKLFSELEERRGKQSPFVQAKVLNNLGCILWKRGQKEPALERFREALKIVTDLKEPKQNLSRVAGQQPSKI